MGYYTQYNGSVISGADEKDVAAAINKLPEFNYKDVEFSCIDDVIAQDEEKWYDFREDMQEISKQFPDALIYIHGEGEDKHDMWDAYFKNGKSVVYMAQITYPEFDTKDLEED